MDGAVFPEFLATAIRIATPLLFAALGGLVSERAGTFAVGIEGMMLAGPFGGAVTTFLHGGFRGRAGGERGERRSRGLIIAVATAKFRADHMVTGLALHSRARAHELPAARTCSMDGRRSFSWLLRHAFPIPYFADLPGVGRVVFQPVAADLRGAAAHAGDIPLPDEDAPGLTLRAVGENPRRPLRSEEIRFACEWGAIVTGGAFAGLGGAVLSLQEVGTFTDGMTNGRGFIALAA